MPFAAIAEKGTSVSKDEGGCKRRREKAERGGLRLGGRRSLVFDALGIENAGKFAGLEHLAHDVAATDELALHVKLRNRRPIRKRLDALTDLVVFEAIHMLVAHAEIVQNLHKLARESALWSVRGAFHEEHDVVLVDDGLNEVIDACHGQPFRIF